MITVSTNLGQAELITSSDIRAELDSRGYKRETITVAPTPIPPVTVAKITRSEAITAAVTNALAQYGHPARCYMSGGCYISSGQYDAIVMTAVGLANQYMIQGYVTGQSPVPTYAVTPVSPRPASPVYSPVYSPSYSPVQASYTYPVRTYEPAGIKTYFTGLGQAPAPPGQFGQQAPPMTTDEKISFGLSLLSSVASTASDYFSARAQRARLEALGQSIPSLTATELAKILEQYKLINPQASATQASQVAAGLFDQPKPTGADWVWPVIAALGAATVILVATKRR